MERNFVIDDRNFETLTPEEKDAVYMRKFGKPYTPPSESEKEQILKDFGLK